MCLLFKHDAVMRSPVTAPNPLPFLQELLHLLGFMLRELTQRCMGGKLGIAAVDLLTPALASALLALNQSPDSTRQALGVICGVLMEASPSRDASTVTLSANDRAKRAAARQRLCQVQACLFAKRI